MHAYHTEEIELDGLTFHVSHFHDDHSGEPWKEYDEHGPVSEWTTRDKLPGELVLNTDRGGSKRFYDYAEACRIARRDGWNAAPYHIEGETPRQQAARAALADFERLRAWCTDGWHWCGVSVELLDEEGEPIDEARLWGIESDATDYLAEVAHELAAELARAAVQKVTA